VKDSVSLPRRQSCQGKTRFYPQVPSSPPSALPRVKARKPHPPVLLLPYSHTNFLPADEDLVDGDVHKLHNVASHAHDDEAHEGGLGDIDELCEIEGMGVCGRERGQNKVRMVCGVEVSKLLIQCTCAPEPHSTSTGMTAIRWKGRS
jgi:hypothetical protein